ncbi:MAG: ATP-binding cassette domain-containing protein [Clostridiales bacterium]|nr:ATP-binding cassette domain-containing protein [Clostridiales bacterium]
MELRNVSFSYDGKPVLENVSLDLSGGRHICVMGESGRGKTTLMRLLLGFISPASGEVIRSENERPSAVFQEDRLLPWFTAERNVREVWSKDRFALSPKELLSEMELGDSLDKLPKELSGGMQRRVAIARALAFGGDPLLLDEPFKGLDVPMRERIAKKVLDLAGNASILLITHDEYEAKLLKCDEIIRL